MQDGVHRMTRRVRLVVLVTALAVASTIGACTKDGRGSDESAGSTSEMCAVTGVLREHFLDRHGFADLVDLPASDPDVEGAAAALYLLRTRYDGDLGPYAPAIDHLASIGREQAANRSADARANDRIRESARKLDRDLAAGACE